MLANKQTTSAALFAMASVVITTFVVAVLYVGREILIPFALAALLSFLLAPIVRRLERWVGRVAAVLLAVAVLFAVVGGIGWVLTRQVLDLATRLPDYKGNIQTKLQALKMPGESRFTKMTQTFEELKKDLPGAERVVEGPPAPPASVSQPIATRETPMPVEVVEVEHEGLVEQLGSILTPLVGPFGTGALALLLLLFMLLQRENLRGRLMRVIGKGNISATTRGMDDAAKRVARYLLMQLIVNATYGIAVAIGLYFIGVPSAFVWGVLAAVLRFIPYVGPWIAATFPIVLSLAVTNNWTMPLLTIGLFVILELLSNNVMEPMLYGSSTGVSSMALILAAVFWTWLWGPAGLVLATPLTVCLVVMGRHVPNLSILSVLLSDEEALSPDEEFYHRLLTPAADDAGEFADHYLKTNSTTALYDSVFLPALTAIERDHHVGQVEDERHRGLHEEMREIIEELGTRPVQDPKPEASKAAGEDAASPPAILPTCRVLCLPARADRDGIASGMLAQLLDQQGFDAECRPAQLTTGELLKAVEDDDAEAVCISVVPPTTVIHARYLCSKLRARPGKLRIIVGLWGATEGLADATQRLRTSGADEVVTSLADAVVQLSKYAAELAQEAALVAPAPDEAERLLELERLHLMDSAADPDLDRITTKLARILDVPIAIVSLVDKDREFFKSQLGLSADLAEARGAARELSICTHVVASNKPLIVNDLARDRRFARNPLIRDNKLRFYAGVPLKTPAGYAIGSLCVLDVKPRTFSEHEKRLLQVTADEVMEILNRPAAQAVLDSPAPVQAG
jgi:predicted PurR-regulated permease PerM/methylmalonyl-CoA mutase cobalamin-binding subunit